MTRAGRLLRQAQAQAVSVCRACGHAQAEHHEHERTDPRYRPLLFACRVCGCEVQSS